MSLDIDEYTMLYTDWELVKMTGWTLEYIRSLGLLTAEAFLQFDDATHAIIKAKRKK